MAMASILTDEGYSQNFDRCYKAVDCCNGNIEQARDLLSKITITEN
jgi:translation elongation factor EF-Ts